MTSAISTLSELQQIKGPLIAVNLWADWCLPCPQMNAVFEKLREIHGNAIKFITVDVEKSDDIPEMFAVTAVPTFLLLKPDLTVANRVDGADAARLTTMIQEAAKTVVSTTSVATNASLKKRLDALVVQQPIMLFMKGTPGSRGSKAVALLKKHEVAFGHVDVLTDDEVRVSMKEYANWPTFPQFWVQGKLVGGLDVITEMDTDGDLAPLLKQAVAAANNADNALNERLKTLIAQAPVMLFMKGDRAQPRCGFSSQMIKILDEHKVQYSTFDILQDQSVRDGLKKYSNWPTFPQLYANSKLIGGLDVVKELVEEKELENALK